MEATQRVRASMEPITTTSLIIFGAIAVSKPLCKLVETVGEHIGLRYEAKRIRDEADAKRYARVQAELTKADVADIRDRMLRGNESRLLRQQENWEAIVRDAPTHLPESVSDVPVDDDWTAQFFEHCKNVSDRQMQSVWSRILAGEVSQPGSFSLRTLHAVKMLRKEDAQLFTDYCQFAWSACEPSIWFLVEPTRGTFWSPDAVAEVNRFYANSGLTTLHRVHLESLNLILLSRVGSGLNLRPCEGTVPLTYHGHVHCLRHQDPCRASRWQPTSSRTSVVSLRRFPVQCQIRILKR